MHHDALLRADWRKIGVGIGCTSRSTWPASESTGSWRGFRAVFLAPNRRTRAHAIAGRVGAIESLAPRKGGDAESTGLSCTARPLRSPLPMQLRRAFVCVLVAVLAPLACGNGGGGAGNDGTSSSSGGTTGRDGSVTSPGTDGSVGPPGADGGAQSDDGGVTVGGPILDGGGAVVPPPPPNNRSTYSFNYGWRFIRMDVAGAQAPAFDDSTWTDVSLPHTFNDVDSWVDWVGFATDMPVMRRYSGLTWYRKHFTLDASYKDRKIFLEFQRVRDAGTFYVNGTKIGIQEDEISPCGLDITSAVQFGADNVIAVQVTNDDLEQDQTYVPGQTFDWSTQAFYPMYGGLVGDANLIVTDKLHQTLPLYRNLGTSGVYTYATASTRSPRARRSR